jgi:uncharacterized protein YhbP (UPF0306 family)
MQDFIEHFIERSYLVTMAAQEDSGLFQGTAHVKKFVMITITHANHDHYRQHDHQHYQRDLFAYHISGTVAI